MTAETTPVSNRRRAWQRGLLAGPVVFIAAALIMCGGALWMPQGATQIDNIVLPIVLFPMIWAALFFYTLLDRKLWRAWTVTLVLAAGHGAAIAQHVLALQAAAKAEAAKVPS